MINLLRSCVRVGGLAALILGVLLWNGMLIGALNLHMTLGAIVAAALAILAVYAIAAHARVPIGIMGLVWAVATFYVGIAQNQWLPGSAHWIVDVIHLLLGIGAIGLAEATAGAINRANQSLTR